MNGDNFPSSLSEVQVRRSFMSALIIVPLAAPAARADFVVAASRPPAPASQEITTGARAPEDNEAFQTNGITTGSTVSTESRFKIAQGFGDGVPLNFAVRQIVPRAVKVTYGPGADPEAPVDWKGGDGWNRVLFRAVHPLGLRLVMTHLAVQIRK